MKFDVYKLQSTPSTNDNAKQAAEAGVAEGLVIVAAEQTTGRGRQGRQWHSPPGNLYCSVLLRPKLARRDYGKFSFVAALALHETVETLLNAKGSQAVQLKWPNDVLVNGKKISGILLEAGEDWLVIGMGLNIRHMPEKPLYPVTCLAAENAEIPALDIILNKLLEALGARYEQLEAVGFEPLRQAWLDRARRGPMRIRQPGSLDGTEREGQFAGLDPDGNLRLLLPDGTERCINTGDVFF